jgi:hypothetical protein
MIYEDNIIQNAEYSLHGYQETIEPEKLYYEAQQDSGDGN